MKHKKISTGFLVLIFLVLSISIVSCKIQTQISKEPVTDNKIAEFASSQELKKFSSPQEIIEFLKKSSLESQSGGIFAKGIVSRGAVLKSVAAAEIAAPQAEAGDAGVAATDYSQTNVQVAGVDEADFVKNDGRYIYTLTQNKLVIVDAFPAENAKILSETELKGRPRNMFVNKDRLVVFAEDETQVPVIERYDFVPRPRYATKTHAFVYDISDRSEPELIKDYNLNGNYFQSRMIGEHIYFIVQENVYYYGTIIDLPVIKQASASVISPEIYYFDNPEDSYNFNTIASFNIFDDENRINAKSFMMGYSNVLYVSQNNIYITYQKNLPYRYYEPHNEERFYKIVVPLLPPDARDKINEIKKTIDAKEMTSESAYYYWGKISGILEDMYNSMEDDERNGLIEKIGNAIQDYESQLEIERRKTVIHKIKIENGKIDYTTKGEVPGYLLNQFSMDEGNGYFRVATTMEFYGRFDALPMIGVAGGGPGSSVQIESVSGEAVAETSVQSDAVSSAKILPSRPIVERKFTMYNNVYVLDDGLEIIGKLEAIAPDERIYSTRFIGDRLYMVTFKRIDPLFVIDLSNPENPEILGELKIPGFSDYLHPYDESHIIGVGKETEGNEWGGVSVKGVKLALFDVSDVKNPRQLDKYEIGEAGTDSEALRDHKAFLFDKRKNLLVIPVTEVKSKPYYDPRLGYYRQSYWQGAYVFSITPEEGFEVKGKITHNEGEEERNYYYYGSPNAVRRALYMDDVLYTVSAIKIKANDIDDISNEIKEIKLPFEKVRYYDYRWY